MNSGMNVSNILAFGNAGQTPNADKVPALPRQPSSAQNDNLTTQPSGTSSIDSAAGVSPSANAAHATADPTSFRAQLQLLQHSDEIGSTNIAEKSRLTTFLFTPKLQNPLLSARRYRIVKELGKGSYGKVFLAWDERRQQLVAVKRQHKQFDTSVTYGALKKVGFLQREIAAMKELHHDNIVEWFHTIETSTDIYVVLEYCGSGTLFKVICQRNGLSEDETKLVFVQVLSALVYMHSKSYCHRDLKNENILITSTEPHLKVKVADFGFVRSPYRPYRGTSFRRVHHMFTVTNCCTRKYASPEQLTGLPYNPLVSDLWSLGVVLFEMIFNAFPFDSSETQLILRLQKVGPPFDWVEHVGQEQPSEEVIDLLNGMLQFNVEERFAMRDVLLHRWTARDFVRYETRRLGLPDGSYRLLPEELTLLPYQLSIKKCDDLYVVQQQHHIHQRQYSLKSLAQMRQIGKTNIETSDGTFHIEDSSSYSLRIAQRRNRYEFNWTQIYADTADFQAKDTVLRAISSLTKMQNLISFGDIPSVQDSLSLLQALLLFYNAGLCSDAQWDEIFQKACVKLNFAIQSADILSEVLTEEYEYWGISSEQEFFQETHGLPSKKEHMLQLGMDSVQIDRLNVFLRARLNELDAFAEKQSPGFVEQKLRKVSNATGHFGLIDLKGGLIECTSDWRPIAIPKDEQNRPVQLTAQPARSLNDVRTVVADLLRGSVYADASPTEAVEKAQGDLLKIRTLLKQFEEDNCPNISPECSQRLRELAEIEADALDDYLKQAGHQNGSNRQHN